MKVLNFEPKEYSRRSQVLQSKGMTYEEFLRSDKWKQAKERLYKRDGKLCKICQSTSNLNVYHNNYNHKNLNGSMRCLVVLCKECHYEVHKLSKRMGWYYKKSVKSLAKRFKKYGSIYYYPERSQVSLGTDIFINY